MHSIRIRNNLFFIFFVFSFLLIPKIGLSDENSKKFGISLGNPWVGIKFDLLPLVNAELRAAIDPEVRVLSARFAYDIHTEHIYKLFSGIEYGIIRFDLKDIDGSGTIITPFIGSECSIVNNLSVAADIGPSLINLESEGISLDGLEYTFNIWIIYYLKH